MDPITQGSKTGNESELGLRNAAQKGDDTVCVNVSANKDLNCPQRAIVVAWETPKTPPNKYKIEILEACKKTPSHYVELDQTKLSHKFQKLKSNTTYSCWVFPLYENGVVGKGGTSNDVKTDKTFRNPNFHITEAGKPEILKCEAILKDDKNLESVFEWNYGNLGKEESNFDFVKTQAYVVDTTKGTKSHLEINGKKAYPQMLNFGSTYKFTLKCTYKDLDRPFDLFETESTCVIDTDIGSPGISNINWKNNQIIFDWRLAEGAKQHFLTVYDNDTKLAVAHRTELVKRPHIITMDQGCSYGKTCKFVLQARAEQRKQKEVRKIVLIGGDRVCSNVIAQKDTECPRRAISVTWNPPKILPNKYILKILEVNQAEVINRQELDTSVFSHKFDGLKTNTKYLCQLRPMYETNEHTNSSFSNEVTTDERKHYASEQSGFSGQSINISHRFVDDGDTTGSIAELSLDSVDVGENCQIEKYYLDVYEKGGFRTCCMQEFSPKVTKIKTLPLKFGKTYGVVLLIVYKDLGSMEKSPQTKLYQFATVPRPANVEECTIESGLIVFAWSKAECAERYQLTVKNEYLSENIFVKQVIKNEQSRVTCQAEMSEQLCIGRTCMTKVIVFGNGLTSESDWKPHLIGGDLVPRNVKAIVNAENPQRSIQITFDAPKTSDALEEYKIVPIPSSKIHKDGLICTNSPFVVEYLRQATEYSFHVSARHADKWSERSLSNKLTTQTQKRPSSSRDVHNVGTEDFDYRRAVIEGGANVTMAKVPKFGQVRDVKSIIGNQEQKDVLEVKWKIPTFDGNASDYKVEKNKVEIRKKNSNRVSLITADFVRGKLEYCTNGHELELGQKYEISITTIYIDIDEDVEYTSNSAKVTVVTRPYKPTVITNRISDGKLNLAWNHAIGAETYVVSMFVNDSNDPLYTRDTKRETFYERPFDENFGFGKTYYALIEAVGVDGKTNVAKTENITIEFPSNWTKDKYLGEGACAKVFLAIDGETGKQLGVVKEVSVFGRNVNTSKEVKSLQNEVDILGRLSHKYIVNYYGSRGDFASLHLFMEYLPAGSVRHQIDKDGSLTEQLTCRYTKQIIEGLSYLHSSKILHRDIKASNVLHDGSGNVKLADFGISKKLVGTIASISGQTIVGTPYWMSPEVIRGERYGKRADIWSLGCTVVEMLTTNPPWHELGAMAAMFKIGSTTTDPKLPKEVSQACSDFIRVIFVERDQRPTTEEISKHSWLDGS